MPVKGKSKKEVVTEFRTAELLEAARRVFAAKGFHDATVDEIADAAGIAKGTVYLYYRSKSEIYWEALRGGIEDLAEQTKKSVEAAKSAEDKIRAFISTQMVFLEERRDFFKIYFSEFGNVLTHPAQVSRHFQELYLSQIRLLESVLAEAVKKKALGKLRVDATAYALADLTRAMITQRLLGWSKGSLLEDIDFVFALIWKGIAHR